MAAWSLFGAFGFGKGPSASRRRGSAPGRPAEVLELRSLLSSVNPLEPSTLDGTNGFTLNGVGISDQAGFSVSSAGDVNGDGFDDVIIGAPNADTGAIDAGGSYVVFGAEAGFPSALNLSALNGTNGFVIQGVSFSDASGRSVSAAGDFNADGFDDLLIGAPLADPNLNNNSGQAYIVYGQATWSAAFSLGATNGTNGFGINGPSTNAQAGFVVSAAGDVNADGFADVIIGAPNATPGIRNGAGISYVLYGASTGEYGSAINLTSLDGTNGFAINGIFGGDASGAYVAGAGDVDGDGFDDVIIGAPNADPGGRTNAGQAYVVFGNASGNASLELAALNGVSGFALNGISVNDFAGSIVSSAGDMDDDGFADIMISSPGATPFIGRNDAGQSYVIFGGPGLYPASFDLVNVDSFNGFAIAGIDPNNLVAQSMGPAGDINNDGYGDIIIGSQFVNPDTRPEAGRSYVIFGAAPGNYPVQFDLLNLDGVNGYAINGTTSGDHLGVSADGAGDFNGDGVSDLITGANLADPNGNTDSGQAYIVFGGNLENDAPVIGVFGANLTYNEGDPALIVTTAATVTDADSATFQGGRLVVRLTANGLSTDRLEVRNQGTSAGQIGVTGEFVTFGGNVIGTLIVGTGTQPLQVQFNALATRAAVQALVRNITFRNVGLNPTSATRTVRFVVSDGDGGVSTPVTKTISVVTDNEAPVLANFGPSVNYVPNSAAVLLSTTITVTDGDSSNFNAGFVEALITGGGLANDVIGLRSQGTGTGQVSVVGNAVSYEGNLIGGLSTFVGGGLRIDFTTNFASKAAVQAVLRNLTFRNTIANPTLGNRTVSVQANDGDGADSNIVSKTVIVGAPNVAPVISNIGGTVSYVASGPPVLVTTTATVTDSDSANFNGGQLTVGITANVSSFDRLQIRNQGTGVGQIGVSGTTISYQGATIGTVSGGSGTTPLTVTFTTNNATLAAVQALLRNVQFRIATGTPTLGARTVSFQVNDGDGGTSAAVTKSITIDGPSTPPVIANLGSTVSYAGTPIIVAGAATVTDSDSASLIGGKLTVRITANASGFDRLQIRNQGTAAGQIGTSGSNVTFGGTIIGTFTNGTGGSPLTVNFTTAAATPAAVQALVRNVQFRIATGTPTPGTRTVSFQASDGDGGVSAAVTKSIDVAGASAAPVIGNLGATVAYTGTPVVLTTTGTVTDADSSVFNGGRLTARVSANASGFDRVEIRNQGTGAGQIGIFGQTVTFGGVAIGTFTVGTGGSPLTIDFTTNSATTAAVQALLRNITFRVATGTPSTATRTLSFQLSDGAGGVSTAVTKSVTVS